MTEPTLQEQQDPIVRWLTDLSLETARLVDITSAEWDLLRAYIGDSIEKAERKALEKIRDKQGGHNLDELCCELCDRIKELSDKGVDK